MKVETIERVDTSGYGELPHARQTGWYKCDHCQNLHVVLRDEAGVAFAVANLDEEMLVDMLATLRGAVMQ